MLARSLRTHARRARAAGAVLALVAAVAPPAAHAASDRLKIEADPGLQPRFTTAAPDYATRCRSGKPVRVSVSAPDGTRVAVDGPPERSGNFTAPVAVAAGQRFTIRVRSDGRARTHHVRCLPSDFPRWEARVRGRPRTPLFVLAPSVPAQPWGYAVVFDRHGAPLWWLRGDPAPFDPHILPDGRLAWTAWIFERYSAARYREYALDGTVTRTFRTVGTPPNAHDFQLLPNGNALLITYVPRRPVDLREFGGSKDAQILDGELQEIDRQGRLVWSWSTRDHIAIDETWRWFRYGNTLGNPSTLPDGSLAYDVFHLNSVQRHGSRVLISLRHADAVYEIDRGTGAVRWKLGGSKTPERLRVLGDPYTPKTFGGQHDARTGRRGRVVQVYDNGRYRQRRARALRFRIDRSEGTARLIDPVHEFSKPLSLCCGSSRPLPGGHALITWGGTRLVTEEDPSGRTVLSLRLDDGTFTYRAEPDTRGALKRHELRRGMDAMAAPRSPR